MKINSMFLEMAAQIWCDPRVKDREMDAELATVIAEKLQQVYEDTCSSPRDYVDTIDVTESVKACGGAENFINVMRERGKRLKQK